MNCAENKELAQKAKEIRKLTLTSIAKVGKGHIGGALSLCEVMSVLYFKHMNVGRPGPVRAFQRPCGTCGLCGPGTAGVS